MKRIDYTPTSTTRFEAYDEKDGRVEVPFSKLVNQVNGATVLASFGFRLTGGGVFSAFVDNNYPTVATSITLNGNNKSLNVDFNKPLPYYEVDGVSFRAFYALENYRNNTSPQPPVFLERLDGNDSQITFTWSDTLFGKDMQLFFLAFDSNLEAL